MLLFFAIESGEYLRLIKSIDCCDNSFPLADAVFFKILIARSTLPVTRSHRKLSGTIQKYRKTNKPGVYKTRINIRKS